MINLRHLSYFVAVVEAGSLSRAAQVIHVAQPSLSQQIAALESDAGATLLQRSTRGVRPTPEGEALYREALAILRRVEDLPTTIRQSPGEITGVVTLGMSTTLASTFAGEILTEATRALPGVRIVLSSSDSERAAAAIAARDVDLGVVFEATPLPRLIRRALFEQRLFVFGATSDILGRAVESRLRDVAVVLPAAPNVTRTAFDRAFCAARDGDHPRDRSDDLLRHRHGCPFWRIRDPDPEG